MKRLTVLVMLGILLAGLALLGLSDAGISVGDTGSPNNEVTTTIRKASNSSASATITITMYTVANE